MEQLEEIDRELERFAQGYTIRDRSDALKSLFTWNVPQARDPDPRLDIGIRALLRAIEAGDERLEAAAALGRLVRGVKATSPNLTRELRDVLVEPLPSATGWADADERLFVARAIEAARPDWSIRYSANFISTDDAAPKARDVFTHLLVAQTGSIQNSMEAILQEVRPTGSFERDARQLRSILNGLRTTMSLSVDVGPETGARVAELVKRLTPRVDGSISRKLRIEAAGDVLSFLSLALRGSLAASFRSESYDAISVVRSWFAPARWPDELSFQLHQLRHRLSEAIETLALRGTPDDSLFRVLETMLGREDALSISRRILAERPGMPASVHSWLRSGPGSSRQPDPQAAETAAEASLRKADPAIARSLLASRALQAELAANPSDGIDGSLGGASAARLGRLAHELIQAVRVAAATRGLKLHGSVGDIVEFDPHLHQQTATSTRTANVRIVQPAVIRQLGDGPATVALLAVVEPI